MQLKSINTKVSELEYEEDNFLDSYSDLLNHKANIYQLKYDNTKYIIYWWNGKDQYKANKCLWVYVAHQNKKILTVT